MNKQELSELVKSNPYFVTVGRVKNWLEDKTDSTLPASCTVFDMTNETLDQTLKFSVYGLTRGAGMTINLPPSWKAWCSVRGLTDEKIKPYTNYEIITSTKRAAEVRKTEDSKFILDVQDSLFYDIEEDGEFSIVESWLLFLLNRQKLDKIYVDLSRLRSPGDPSPSGVVPSGAKSFGEFYHFLYELQLDFSLTNFLKFLSKLNEIIKRGGKKFKKGAIVVFEDLNSPDHVEYLTLHLHDIPYLKKALYLSRYSWQASKSKELVAGLVDSGQLWIAKKQHDSEGNRLFSNVCLEILLPHRGTCILGHVNLGLIGVGDIEKLPDIFRDCMMILCEIHKHSGVNKDGYYLSPTEDKQVGLGVVGLANMLQNFGLSYEDFVKILENGWHSKYIGLEFRLAFDAAEKKSDDYEMHRCFTVAPTASCSFDNYDLLGFVTTPNIAPPKSQKTSRISELEGGSFIVEYPINVETAKEVGFDTYYKLCNLWQEMMGEKAHSISMDLWMDKEINVDWITQFIHDSVKTTYYRLSIDEDINDKSDITQSVPDCDCGN